MTNWNILFENWEALGLLERYDKIVSFSDAVRYSTPIEMSNALVEDVLNKIESLRYALAHNKATESNSARLDRTLALAALSLATRIYSGKALRKYVESVNYYESDEELKSIYARLAQ